MSLFLDNIDYNYLKHFIKVNTTRDAAKAIAIPGQPDTRLSKVEDELYNELCAQHDRAGLFVSAKADEINRRLRMLDPCGPFPDCHLYILWLGRRLQLLSTACANIGSQSTSHSRYNDLNHDVPPTIRRGCPSSDSDASRNWSVRFSDVATIFRVSGDSSMRRSWHSGNSSKNTGYDT